eukprot:926448_1
MASGKRKNRDYECSDLEPPSKKQKRSILHFQNALRRKDIKTLSKFDTIFSFESIDFGSVTGYIVFGSAKQTTSEETARGITVWTEKKKTIHICRGICRGWITADIDKDYLMHLFIKMLLKFRKQRDTSWRTNRKRIWEALRSNPSTNPSKQHTSTKLNTKSLLSTYFPTKVCDKICEFIPLSPADLVILECVGWSMFHNNKTTERDLWNVLQKSPQFICFVVHKKKLPTVYPFDYVRVVEKRKRYQFMEIVEVHPHIVFIELNKWRNIVCNSLNLNNVCNPSERILCILGKGSYGTVYMVRRNNVVYAVKTVKESNKTELRIMKQLQNNPHRNVIHLLSAQTTNNTIKLFMECGVCDLKHFLKETSDSISIHDIGKISICILNGINHIHQHGFIHGDIKPSNIIVCSDHSIKLCDFGAAFKSGVRGTNGVRGTLLYNAPEMILGWKYDRSIDLFAFGATMGFLFADKHIFKPLVHTTPLKKMEVYKQYLTFLDPQYAPYNAKKRDMPTIDNICKGFEFAEEFTQILRGTLESKAVKRTTIRDLNKDGFLCSFVNHTIPSLQSHIPPNTNTNVAMNPMAMEEDGDSLADTVVI